MKEPNRSAQALADKLKERLTADPGFSRDLGDDPERIQEFVKLAVAETDAQDAKESKAAAIEVDAKIYNIVVYALGVCVVGVVLAITIIAVIQLTNIDPPQNGGAITIVIPDGLIALGSAAIGALAGLLAPLSSRR